MKIILQKPVDNLGNPGDVTEVADGYARNYLIPRGLAIKAEKGALKQAETLKRGHYAKLSKQKGEYEAVASKLIAAGLAPGRGPGGRRGQALRLGHRRRHRRGDRRHRPASRWTARTSTSTSPSGRSAPTRSGSSSSTRSSRS